jgi:hypothetical protein
MGTYMAVSQYPGVKHCSVCAAVGIFVLPQKLPLIQYIV